MATRRLDMICLLCVLVSLAGGCTRTRPGERIAAKGADSAVWSKDGQSLYYTKGYHDLYRYDVVTGRRQTYRIGKEVSEHFDLSPDERKVVLEREYEGIYIGDLKTGRIRLVYPTQESILDVEWPSAEHITFSVSPPDAGELEQYLLDPSSGSVTRFKYGSSVRISASEGGGFAYLDKNDHYRYHNLDSETDKALPSCPPFGSDGDVYFIYLDDQKLIYNVWRSAYLYTEIVDLKTMRTRRMLLPDVHPDMVLSPDLAKFWYTGPQHSDMEPLKLYLVDVPPQTVKQLKVPVK